MTDVLDPTKAYILALVVLIIVGVGTGYVAGGRLSLLGSAIFAGFLGFLSGIYTSREETDIFGSLVLTGGFAALVTWFLPLGVTWGVAVFLVGFVSGMRTERRQYGHHGDL